jgi:hypothetical protein
MDGNNQAGLNDC